MSDHLLREHAPISDGAWAAIEDDVTPKLKTQLAARKLVDFTGPGGWDLSSVNSGRARPIAEPSSGLTALQRVVMPLVELRAEFTLSRRELEDADRGARDLDLSALDEAAAVLARAENRAVFHGYADAGIRGLVEVGTHDSISLGSDPNRYPAEIAPRSTSSARPGSADRTVSRSRRRSTPRSSNRPSTAATRCSNTCIRSSRGRSCGLPGSTAARS